MLEDDCLSAKELEAWLFNEELEDDFEWDQRSRKLLSPWAGTSTWDLGDLGFSFARTPDDYN